MLNNLVKYINQLGDTDVEADFSDEEVAEAIASLMRQLIIADGKIKDEEILESMDILRENYSDLVTEDNEASLAFKLKQGGAESIFPLITIVKNKLSPNRLNLLKSQLLMIAKSDNEYHEMEKELISLVNNLSD